MTEYSFAATKFRRNEHSLKGIMCMYVTYRTSYTGFGQCWHHTRLRPPNNKPYEAPLLHPEEISFSMETY